MSWVYLRSRVPYRNISYLLFVIKEVFNHLQSRKKRNRVKLEMFLINYSWAATDKDLLWLQLPHPHRRDTRGPTLVRPSKLGLGISGPSREGPFPLPHLPLNEVPLRSVTKQTWRCQMQKCGVSLYDIVLNPHFMFLGPKHHKT